MRAFSTHETGYRGQSCVRRISLYDKKKKKIILVELAGQDAWLPTIVYVTVHLTKIKLKKDCSVGHPDKIYK